jgi:hypothetical protein
MASCRKIAAAAAATAAAARALFALEVVFVYYCVHALLMLAVVATSGLLHQQNICFIHPTLPLLHACCPEM